MSFYQPVPFEDRTAGVACRILLDQPNGQRVVRVDRIKKSSILANRNAQIQESCLITQSDVNDFTIKPTKKNSLRAK
jgi:hypothetical protein